jgi:hypothetical protein
LGVPMRHPAPAASSKPAGDLAASQETALKAVGMSGALGVAGFTSWPRRV